MGWRMKRLGELCEINPPKTNARRTLAGSELVSFVPMNDVGVLTKIVRTEQEKPLNDVIGSYTYFADDDVLLAKITPCFENGKLGIVRGLTNGIGFGSSEFLVLRSLGEIDPEFLFYFLAQDSFREVGARRMTGAVGHKRIPKEFVEEHPLCLPSLTEQRRIVAILDEAFVGIDAAVANAEKNIVNTRELLESYMKSVFTSDCSDWHYKKLGEVAVDFSRGKSKHRPRNDPKLFGGPFPFIQTGDIRQSKQLITEASQFYNEVGLAQSKLWPKGTICITIAANIAETAILDLEACFPDSVIGMVVDKKQASNRFVEYLLRHMKTMLKAEGKGSAQDNINLGTFDRTRFPFPPLAEQHRIAEELDRLTMAVQLLSETSQRKLQNLVELKQSILRKAFAGELTAKEAERELAAA